MCKCRIARNQKSTAVESRIGEDFACRIGNPELWNCFFPFFIYLFIFLDFWDQDKHAILTSRFDNAFQVFPVNLYGIHNSKSAVQWFIFMVGHLFQNYDTIYMRSSVPRIHVFQLKLLP